MTEPRYRLRVLSLGEPPQTPALYTSLLLATVPRLRRASPLRRLPQELIQLIARFAHTPGYRAAFALQAPFLDSTIQLELNATEYAKTLTYRLNELGATCLDASEYYTEEQFLFARPIRVGTMYVEVELSAVWYGTEVSVMFDGGGFIAFGFGTDPVVDSGEYLDENTTVFLRDETMAVDPDGRFGHWVKSIGHGVWKCCDIEEPKTAGLLVDMHRGCVTFRLHGIDGPCVAFPTSVAWQNGVRMSVNDLPSHGAEVVRVSCSTPPIPSSLSAAAEVPRSIAELVGSGALSPGDFLT